MSASFGPIIGDALANYALISTSTRSIGTLIPDVVTEEIHRDVTDITLHPLMTGTPTSDHAFDMPSTVEMRCGWSDSTAEAVGYPQLVYQELQALQQAHQPFTVSTGKRVYQNMLIASLIVKTDIESEYALMVIAVLQQLIFVSAQSSGTTTPNSDGYDGSAGGNGALVQQNAQNAGLTVSDTGNVQFATPVTGQPTGIYPTSPSAGGTVQLVSSANPGFGWTTSSFAAPGAASPNSVSP